jgi:hypothetical protein
MKKLNRDENLVGMLARLCEFHNQEPSGAAEDQREIEDWRARLPRPVLGPQISMRNCMDAETEG